MKNMKKIKKTQNTTQEPRFKQGAGTSSWKLALALALALALGIGGGIAMSQNKTKPALTDFQLGIPVTAPAQGAEG
jgi:ABC-type nitrate/sulfonate/bicarbonate transport system permease component